MSRELVGLDRPPLTRLHIRSAHGLSNPLIAAEVLRSGMDRIAGQMETTGDEYFRPSWNRDLALESLTMAIVTKREQLPEGIQDDQIEDWLRGRFVATRLAIGDHQSEWEGGRWVTIEEAFPEVV